MPDFGYRHKLLKHTNNRCFFLTHPYRFNKQFLKDYKFLETIPNCDCFQFAYVHNNPIYQNIHLTDEDFETFLKFSTSWEFVKTTKFKYNLNSGHDASHRDPFFKSTIKEYDPQTYYQLCDSNKTPKKGRMWFSLLQYLYPKAPKPIFNKERYFYNSLNKAIKFVFDNFDKAEPIHYREAINVMPKNTSAGFNGLEYSGSTKRMRKDEILPFIEQKYLDNCQAIRKNEYPDDYCMFAMRGHLSSRLKTKTRPVWLVSASTIVAELKYYQPFYDQFNNKDFFRERFITGKKSLPRLNNYLRRHRDSTFINTDITGWDSFRASWFHEQIMDELAKKIIFRSEFEKKEYQYLKDSAIRTKVLFPNGNVYQKFAGIISGTAGTLLFNSLINCVAGYTILNMMKLFSLDDQFDFITKVMDPNWLGDDFAFYTNYKFDLETFSRLMFKYFNLEIKPEKTIITDEIDERKYLGYQLRYGFLYRPRKDILQSLLYTERPFPKEHAFAISFSRFFSYLLLGGINDYYVLDLFYCYMGKWYREAEKADYLFHAGLDNIFKLLKDVWNIQIPSFNLNTFRNMNLELMKYVLLYGYDLRFSDLTW